MSYCQLPWRVYAGGGDEPDESVVCFIPRDQDGNLQHDRLQAVPEAAMVAFVDGLLRHWSQHNTVGDVLRELRETKTLRPHPNWYA